MLKKLIAWSAQFSHLPWRKERTLYRTLVSEIMLQQTTVATVLGHFERFLAEYPTIEKLAAATPEQLTISWRGLGYYRRARNLQKACAFIVEKFQGEIPLDYETLTSIPGIGPYTASAIIGIGADQPALAVDANLERVLARLFGLNSEKGLKLQKEIQAKFQTGEIYKKEFSKLSSRAINEALMDLGRNFCRANKASCELCPMSSECVAAKEKNALAYPRGEKKVQKFYELELLRYVVKKKNKVLVYKKQDSEWLAGQYELPTFVLSSEDKKFKQYPALKTKLSAKPKMVLKSGITKYNITNYIKVPSEAEVKKYLAAGYEFMEISPKSNLGSTTFKILEKMK
ncbi:MAG: A/G-specific adenine glycosylase [Bacteriovoracaceae bacterium]|nr:A/G-specific adenine glycosylase [Bacteriovoracaceae bacterium]